jgi:hypothetical protein
VLSGSDWRGGDRDQVEAWWAERPSLDTPGGTATLSGAVPAAAARWASVAPHVVPVVMAVAFGLLALRGVGDNTPIESDATRHAMNGAFIYDLVREGGLRAPLQYGLAYYSRLPAVSLPYHPPLFPGIEALSFVAFGVQAISARVLVALAGAVSAYLLYGLVRRTHGSSALAVAATAGFLSLDSSLGLSADIMLEFPMLAFVLGAMHCVLGLERAGSPTRFLAVAFLASAAVWTKQPAVFVGLVPFIYAGISGQREFLRARALWCSAGLWAGAVLALLLISRPLTGGGPPQLIALKDLWLSLGEKAGYYAQLSWAALGLWLIPAIGAVVLGLMPDRRHAEASGSGAAIYLAWVLAGLVPLLLAGHHDGRYAFMLCAPLVVLGFAGVFRLARRLLPRPWAVVALMVPMLAWMISNVASTGALATRVEGPTEVARHIVQAGSHRVLYCSYYTDGHFIFALRRLASDARVIVIRGDKLPAEMFENPARVERFARRYGIEHVVLEETKRRQHAWDGFTVDAASPLVLERDIAMVVPRASGTLRVFRFTQPSRTPAKTLVVPVGTLGHDTMDVSLRLE